MNNFDTTNSSVYEPIVLAGIGCRLPGLINDPTGFWNLLQRGEDVFTDWSPERIPGGADNVPAGYFKGAYLEDVARFDADFFNISPHEAAAMDPQQRLLLEVVWESLEDAGWPIDQVKNTQTGVFMGAMNCDYGGLQPEHPSLTPYTALGTDTSLIANRVSYFLGLQGPSLTVNTASSSSLVAVHLACQSLRAGEIEMALVGGVNLILNLRSSRAMEQMRVLSPDGRGHAFTVGSKGYVRGEGIVCITLKTLRRALADNDRIYCLISGSAVNNNGAHSSIAAPNRAAQVQLLDTACRKAGISPRQVRYVEAHGSGTSAGDRVELAALTEFFGSDRSENSPLPIGTVKNNIGHLEAAAGIAGLIKAALAIFNRELPGSRINGKLLPAIDGKNSPLRLLKHSENWPIGENAAIAGVSSFGYGGTNCHVVLRGIIPTDIGATTVQSGSDELENSSPNRKHLPEPEDKPYLVPVSACSPEALAEFAQAAARTLANESEETVLRDWAYTAALRRTHHPLRKAILADSCAELHRQLMIIAGTPINETGGGRTTPAEIVLWLTEAETRWHKSIDTNLLKNSIYRRRFQECVAVVRQRWGWNLTDNSDPTEELSPETDQSVQALLHWARHISLLELAKATGLPTGNIITAGIGTVIAEHLTGALTTSEAAGKILDWSVGRRNSPSGPDRQMTGKYSWFASKKEEFIRERYRILVTVCDVAGTREEINARAELPITAVDAAVIGLQTEEASGIAGVLKALGEIYEKGGVINWQYQYPHKSGKLVSLPLYKWQGRSYWLTPDGSAGAEPEIWSNPRKQPKKQLSENGRGTNLAEGKNQISQPELQIYGNRVSGLLNSISDYSDCLSVVKNYLHKLLSDSLGCKPAEIDPAIPLLYLGVESLTAMDLEDSIATDWRIKVSLKQQLNELSLDQLAELVAVQLIFLRRQSSGGLEGFKRDETGADLEFKRL